MAIEARVQEATKDQLLKPCHSDSLAVVQVFIAQLLAQGKANRIQIAIGLQYVEVSERVSRLYQFQFARPRVYICLSLFVYVLNTLRSRRFYVGTNHLLGGRETRTYLQSIDVLYHIYLTNMSVCQTQAALTYTGAGHLSPLHVKLLTARTCASR